MKAFLLFLWFIQAEEVPTEEKVPEVVATPAPVERELDAIEKASAEPLISNEFKQGEHLIYDCRGHHYACVNDISFSYCQDLRDEAIERKKDSLPCAPLTKFKSQKECFKEQYKQIHQQKNKTFCIHYKNKLKR